MHDVPQNFCTKGFPEMHRKIIHCIVYHTSLQVTAEVSSLKLVPILFLVLFEVKMKSFEAFVNFQLKYSSLLRRTFVNRNLGYTTWNLSSVKHEYLKRTKAYEEFRNS